MLTKGPFCFCTSTRKKFHGALFGFRGSKGLLIGRENERCAREMDETKRTIHPMKQVKQSPTNHRKKFQLSFYALSDGVLNFGSLLHYEN